MDKIKNIEAREILDSRGNPTIEVCLSVKDKLFFSSVPSGASTGSHEAVELRDGGERYNGKGVLNAVEKINSIINSEIKNKSVLNQKEIDDFLIELDGTKNKSRLGGNSILAVSMAVCRAGAFFRNKEVYQYISEIYGNETGIPVPCFNVINGGAHAVNSLDFQEFMIVPKEKNFSENLMKGVEIYQKLKQTIENKESIINTGIGDEGGFAPLIEKPEEAIALITESAEVDLMLDVAAGEFFDGKNYKTSFKSFSSEELIDYYVYLIDNYPVKSIEDPFHEDDWENWKKLNLLIGSKVLIIGDDLIATNPERIKKAGEEKACNAMILKLNQIGTVTESLEAAKLARQYNWKIMISHRSGETNDDFISDFAVGINAEYIKSGAPVRGERVSKYNRLLKIEQEKL